MSNQHGNEEYPPGVQSIIDRFIAGEIEPTDKVTKIGKHDRPVTSSRDGWHDDHESAVEGLENKKAQEGNYYERLKNRGRDA